MNHTLICKIITQRLQRLEGGPKYPPYKKHFQVTFLLQKNSKKILNTTLQINFEALTSDLDISFRCNHCTNLAIGILFVKKPIHVFNDVVDVFRNWNRWMAAWWTHISSPNVPISFFLSLHQKVTTWPWEKVGIRGWALSIIWSCQVCVLDKWLKLYNILCIVVFTYSLVSMQTQYVGKKTFSCVVICKQDEGSASISLKSDN